MRTPCDEASVLSTGAGKPVPNAARGWILAATILGSSMAFIDSTVVNVALPALQTAFRATVVDVQWIVESYGLFLAALILVGGSLGDLFGRRIIFLSGVAIFAVASGGCGLSQTINQLILARSLQGVGAALLVPGSLAIISSSFDEKSRGQAIGTWSAFTAITTAIGPVLGGWLVSHASWRWIFFLNLPLAVAVAVISLWRIPESRSSSAQRVDWLGASLATVGLGALIGALIESSHRGWKSPLVFGGLIASVGCLAAFLYVEAHISGPMLPLGLFKNRRFSGANLLTLVLYSAVGIFFFLFPLNLIQIQGYSPASTGAAILPLILLMFLLSRWSGGLVARYGPTMPLIVGPLTVALGFALFSFPSIGHSYWTAFFPAIIILGLGMAITVAPLTTVVMSSVAEDRAGTASGINNAVARVAGVLAIAVVGIIMLQAFGARLDHLLANLSLAEPVLREIHAHEIQLGALPVPVSLDPSTRIAVQEAIRSAFVSGFRIVMLICTILALTAGVVAWRMIPKSTQNR
jgi:EmrB/QacA subfamily drug resistance transporter